MQGVSEAWNAAVRSGAAQMAVRADVIDPFGRLLASTESAVGNNPQLEIAAGDVQVDATADFLRRVTNLALVVNDERVVPDSDRHFLANVTGNEVRLYRGFAYDGIAPELVPLGVFGLADDDTDDTGSAIGVGLTLYDRGRRMSRAKFIRTYTIPAGTNFVDAIVGMLRAGWDRIVIHTQPTTFTTPFLSYDPGDDRWGRAKEMAASIGFDLYFDTIGECHLERIVAPSPQAPVAFDYSEGPLSTLLSVHRKSSNENVNNGVIVTGSSSSAVTPPRGEAWDTNPDSPTHVGYDPSTGVVVPGPYGLNPLFVNDPLQTSHDQCLAAAQAKLLQVSARSQQVTFGALVNAAHEHRDLVRIARERAKIDDVYEMESFNIPLVAGTTMNATTKLRRAS